MQGKILKSCDKVYTSYKALDYFKTKKFNIDGTNCTLSDFIKENTDDGDYTITINQVRYQLKIVGQKVSFSKTPPTQNITIEAKEEYDDAEILALLSQQNYILDKNNKSIQISLKTEANEEFSIGGFNKIDIYPEHLDTLLKIKRHIAESDGDLKKLSSMLIALATGSGKTFVQALWFLVLKVANVNGIFALPDVLVEQLKNDFKRLLPNELVDSIQVLKQHELPVTNVSTLLQDMKGANQEKAQYLIGSYEALLDNYYQNLLDIPNNQAVISFDEQHLVMNQEARKYKLQALAKNKLAMFLTATPTEETYKLCGNKAVAYMSLKAKAQAGHGGIPHIRQTRAQDLNAREQLLADDQRIGGFDNMLLAFADAFQTQRSSPIHTVFEQFNISSPNEFFHKKAKNSSVKPNDKKFAEYHNLRWNYQPPTSRKMLVIADDNEELINLANVIKNTDYLGDNKSLQIKFLPSQHINKNLDKNTLKLIEEDPNTVYICLNQKDCQYYLIRYMQSSSDENFKAIAYPIDAGKYKQLHRDLLNFDMKQQISGFSDFDERQLLKKLTDCDKEVLPKDFFTPHDPEYQFQVYKDGNIVSRSSIYNFLMQRDNKVDNKISSAWRDQKKMVVENQFQDAKFNYNNKDKDKLRPVSLSEQLDRNIFSGIVDYLLQDLTGLSLIELNQQRAENFDSIFEKIQVKMRDLARINKDNLEQKYKAKLLFNEQKNPKGIDEAGATDVAKMITELVKIYGTFTTENKKYFIDNWSLINPVRDFIFSQNSDFTEVFNPFAKKFRSVFLMKDMEQAETSIENSIPFSNFNEKKIAIRNQDGTLSKDIKNRDKSAIEMFNPTIKEHHYSPQYLSDIPEHIIDNYFKNGFIGMLVSNKKTEGFSDLNLHTIISTVPTNNSSTNNPAKAIQGLGRSRGKDPTQKSYFYNALGLNAQPFFDLNNLNKDEDYYPQFIEGTKEYNEQSLVFIGRDIAKAIKNHVYMEKNIYDQLDMKSYNDATHLIILKAFRQIYNNNAHDMGLSKAHLKIALEVANDYLIKQCEKLAVPYRLAEESKFIGSTLDTIYGIPYYLATKDIKSKLADDSKAIKNANSQKKSISAYTKMDKNALLYADIITRADYHKLNEKQSTFGEINNVFDTKLRAIEANIKGLVIKALNTKPEIVDLNKQIIEKLLPLFAAHVNPEKQKFCLSEAAKVTNWHSLLINEQDLFNQFEQATAEKKSQIAIKIFRKVPSLHHYLSVNEDVFLFDRKQQNQEELNRLFKEEFLPCMVKNFDPLAQKKILETVKDYNDWGSILEKRQTDPDLLVLNQSNISDSEKLKIFKKLSINMLKDTEKFNNLNLELVSRDYEQSCRDGAKQITNKFQQIVQSVALSGLKQFFSSKKSNATPEEQITEMLSTYISGDFINDIEPFLINKDLVTYQRIVCDRDIAKDFAKYIFEQSKKKKFQFNDHQLFLTLSKNFFKNYQEGKYKKDIESIKFMPEHLAIATDHLRNISEKIITQQQDISNIQKKLSEEFISSYDKSDPKEKIYAIKKEILPIISLEAFKKTVLDTIGHLNAKHILLLVERLATNNQDANKISTNIIELRNLMRKGDIDTVFDKFLKDEIIELFNNKISTPDSPVSNKFTQTWEFIKKIHETQIDCYSFFHGELNTNPLKSKDKSVERASLSLKVSNDIIRAETDIFSLHALQTSMPINSEVNALTNKATADHLKNIQKNIVQPMLNVFNHDFVNTQQIDSIPLKESRSITQSAVRLANRIEHLSPLTADYIAENSNRIDAIDALIDPIIKSPACAQLWDWWRIFSKPQSVTDKIARSSSEIRLIDLEVMHSDLKSNRDLTKIYDKCTAFMRNTMNSISPYFNKIRALRREVYSLIVKNDSQEKNNNEDYQQLITNIKTYLQQRADPMQVHYRDDVFKECAFNSTTIRKMRDILLDKKLSVADQLLKIQFLARDYKDNGKVFVRNISHFFSDAKTKEGAWVKEFCTKIGTMQLNESQQRTSLITFLENNTTTANQLNN